MYCPTTCTSNCKRTPKRDKNDEFYIRDRKLHALKHTIKREDDFMSHLWNHAQTRKRASYIMDDDIEQSKCAIIAETFKIQGNEQFQARNYSGSIQFYTESAMYAPEHSPQYSVAIANRSAALFFLNRYKDCIKDIDLAIELNCPKKLHYKLHMRKVQCYLKLGNPELAENMISKIRESIDDPNYIAPSMKALCKKQLSGITFNLSCTPDKSKNIVDPLHLRSTLMFDENPNFPHASSSIDRKFNDELGRRVVANRFIRKGEVLFFEKPLSFALENDDVAGRTCQHCCRSTDIPVPCPKCLNTFYCDTNCLNEAWSSCHRWECLANQMGLWEENMPLQSTLKVFLICSTSTDASKFNEMHKLVSNFDEIPIEQMTNQGLIAMMLTLYLFDHTDFFQEHDLNDHFARKCVDNSINSNFHAITDDNKYLYVSSLFLRYIQQLAFNDSLIFKNSIKPADHLSLLCTVKTDIVGRGLYTSASMMNRSCDMNIVMNFVDQYQIIRASRDIAANEEIFFTFGQHYRYTSTEERQKQMSGCYYYTCKCKPCTQSNLKYFVERFTAMNCSKCNGALCKIKNSLFCLDCSDKPKHFEQQRKIKQAERLFKRAETFIAREDFTGALKKLEECLSIRRRTLYKSHKDIVSTLHVLSNIYVTLGKPADAKRCWESMIAAVTERFGPSSVELMGMLLRFAMVGVPFLLQTSKTTASSYKALSTTADEYMEQVMELADLHYGSWSEVYKTYKLDYDALMLGTQ
ncbi:protein-lysine N-methyltransferase SMYD4-like [Lasioglossum baleicum]|uniref:protein-lysine N-methyltransferase SMYD4-like n=1 Tax=Lasioglossum baleicum TaxID=434251 RepID=UPI003FCD44B6